MTKDKLYVSIPNVYYWERIARIIKRGFGIPVSDASHLQSWDIITLKQLIYQVGFKIINHRWSIFEKEIIIIIVQQ